MPLAQRLSLRVNGREYTRVVLQCGLQDGYPVGPQQVVIQDDTIPAFSLTDDFLIELREDEGDWKRVTLRFLLTLLLTYSD